MRVFRFVAARRLPGGLFLPLALVLVACGTSPTEQLTRAEKLLDRLESKGADQYLTYDMADVRRQIEEVKKSIRKNSFETAGRSLYNICQKLDSCGVAFMRLQRMADSRSREWLVTLSSQVQVLEETVALLPRQTYIDQNRHDIHVHRLRYYREEIEALSALVHNQEFPEALRAAAELESQIEKTFAGLAVSNEFAAEKTPKREAPSTKKTEQQKEEPRITGVLISSTR